VKELFGNLELIEEIDCPYCHSSEKQSILVKNNLRIVKCMRCNLRYTDRRLNKKGVLLYYQEGYFTGRVNGAYKNYIAEERERLIDFDLKYKFLKKFIERGVLLDVGCATGFSLIAAQLNGFTPEGVDLSEWAVHQNKTGLKIFNKDLTELEGEGKYDIISMWDVIEHFLEPEKAFCKLNRLLRPGGFLIFTYPDPTLWMARMLGKRWIALTPEEHYFFFPPKILEDWLGKFGFKKVYECHEKRYFTLRKLSQKIAPFAERYMDIIGIGDIGFLFRIPYKKMVVFKKVEK